jgi:subtilisin family serine protease
MKMKNLLQFRTIIFVVVVIVFILQGCGQKPEESTKVGQKQQAQSKPATKPEPKPEPQQPEPEPIADVRPSDTSKAVKIPESPYPVIPYELVVLLEDGETVGSFKESVAGKGIKVVGSIPNFNIVQIEVPADKREALMDELNQNPLVKSVSYQTVYSTDSSLNDPALNNDDIWDDWGLEAIGAEEAWKITRGDPDIIIAVVDSGVLLNHEELKGKIVAPVSVFSGDSRQVGSPEGLMHGTHVAIVAAGSGNNGLGTSGVAPDCRIMPVQVLLEGSGSYTQILVGIDYAVRNGARVINLSLGKNLGGLFDLHDEYRDPGFRDSAQSYLLRRRTADETSLNIIMTAAEASGVTVVVASGNDNLPGDFGDLCYNQFTLGVGNVGQYADGVITPASSSNYGFMVRVSAPGTNIYSGDGEPGGSGYQWLTGTSMAAPYVTGLAALVASVNPGLKPHEIRQVIIDSSISNNLDKSAPIQWNSSAQKVFHEMDLWRQAFLLLTEKDENLSLPDTMEQLLVSLIPPEHNNIWDGPYPSRTGEAVWHDEKAVGGFINVPAALKSAVTGSFRNKFAAFTEAEIEKAVNIKPEKLLQVYDMLKLADRYAASAGLGVPFTLKFNLPLERLDVIREKSPGGDYAEWLEYAAPGEYRHFAVYNGKDYRQGTVRVGRRGKVSNIINLIKDEVFYYQSLE